MNNYTAITIGPIYQTISFAKKTREIWAASFIFSMLMKKIIDGILKENKDNKNNIIIPYATNYPELKAVGLYPDRLLYKRTLENINSIITDAINDLSVLIGIKEKGYFLKEYLQVYYFSSDKIENVCGKNYVEKLNLVLDSLELERKITSSNNIKTISNFFKKLPNTKLYQDHFEKEYEKKVKSLVEISTAGLSGFEGYDYLVDQYINKVEEEDDDSNFLEGLQQKIKDPSFTFQNYHKYVAVIYADGDKMGEMIGKIVENNDLALIHKVSNILFEWAKEVADKIKNFGGLPIYAGGDDLLCFTPIVNEGKNIIEILKEISDIFTEKFENSFEENDFREKPKFPTMSFGVSIAYYKYPLNESLEKARELLHKMKKDGGNGVYMRMLKHSGSDFDFVLKLNSNEWFSVFESLMNIKLTETMLSSTAYHLQDNAKVMDEIADQPDRVKQFFINKMDGYPKNANENPKHYLLEVEKLVNIAFKEKIKDEKGKYINRMFPTYDMLRLVKFFKGLDNAS
ncbi:hypothetical protein EZS27_020051 [termite gut metagenome]|uniref:GGDEF domain-containing protein n=1 Tax=termite gut metagenome TaxID=433724 RepID=A0A5J4RDR3_9ZZZZ